MSCLIGGIGWDFFGNLEYGSFVFDEDYLEGR